MNQIDKIKQQDTRERKDDMNVLDISDKDVTKTYSLTINEADCKSWDDYNVRVNRQRLKLERGIFAHKGNFYYAKYRIKDLTEREHDPVIDQTTTICRKVKFKWSYVFLK